VGETAATALVPTLSVRVAADTVTLVLRVSNGGSEAVRVEFASAQRFDFAVKSGAQEVWRWSSGMGFAQVVGEEVLEPGGSLEYEAAWVAGERSGTFEAVGFLTSMNHPVELRTPFEVIR
jgi:hypothetical protein